MKLFLDTADVEAIKKANDTGLLDGVTTNPSSLAKCGRRLTDVVKEICEIVQGPVSVEAITETADEMIEEAQQISSLAPNVVVKIPMTVDGMKATTVLESEKGVKVNVTMVFSPTQAYLAMKAGASYVSIVLGRLDACAMESGLLIEDTVTIKNNYGYPSEIIAGSMKTQNHVIDCLRSGVDIVTVPHALFLQMFQHPLTDDGIAQFCKDWAKIPK